MTDDKKKLVLRVLKITAVVVPVLVGAVTAYLTGTPFDIIHAIQVVGPVLVGQ
jgi:hypothetical protein